MNLAFLGAAGTVTGSKTLVTREGKQLLVDCGLTALLLRRVEK